MKRPSPGWADPRFVLILVSGFFASQGQADDILSHSQAVGDALLVHTRTALLGMALQQTDPLAAARFVGRSLADPAPERIHILASDGRVLASKPGPCALPESARRQVLAEPTGVGTYHAFAADYARVVRRDLGWSRKRVAGREWIVVVERDRPFQQVVEEPLTGRWMGAFSYAGFRAGEAPLPREAGPMSVLILQEGDRCVVRAVSQRFNLSCTGLVSGTNLTAGADSSPGQPTVILEAGYAPDEDKIRGTLHLVGGDAAGRATIFLQRAPDS